MTDNLLHSLDPAAGPALIPEADREADLRRILSTGRESTAPAHARRRGRLFTVVAAALAVAATASPFVPRPQPAFAVTPAALTYSGGTGSATAVLTGIAARAEAAAEPARAGDHEHLVTLSWHLWTSVDGEQVRSAVVPARHESWRGPDDSGRTSVRFESPQFPAGADRLTWLLDGAEGLFDRADTTDHPAGGFPAMWRDRPPASGFAAWLAQGHPPENGPAETIVAATDLARERLLSPAARAALLRTVAAVPGLTHDGDVTDRAGRTGQAFSLVSGYAGLPTRYTLIVDPATGQLLGHEQTLTERAGKLDVRIPAVIGYEIYAEAAFSPAPGR